MNQTEELNWPSWIFPIYAITLMGTGVASGIVALVAVLRKHEHALLIWLPS